MEAGQLRPLYVEQLLHLCCRYRGHPAGYRHGRVCGGPQPVSGQANLRGAPGQHHVYLHRRRCPASAIRPDGFPWPEQVPVGGHYHSDQRPCLHLLHADRLLPLHTQGFGRSGLH
ncbi:hypothetical protein D3C81_1966520 [compost metagenome]